LKFHLHALSVLESLDEDVKQRGIDLLEPIVAMLTRLCR
jgi:hypothetical protein